MFHVKHVFKILTISVLSFWKSISNMLSSNKLAFTIKVTYGGVSVHNFKELIHPNNALLAFLLYIYLLNNVKEC